MATASHVLVINLLDSSKKLPHLIYTLLTNDSLIKIIPQKRHSQITDKLGRITSFFDLTTPFKYLYLQVKGGEGFEDPLPITSVLQLFGHDPLHFNHVAFESYTIALVIDLLVRNKSFVPGHWVPVPKHKYPPPFLTCSYTLRQFNQHYQLCLHVAKLFRGFILGIYDYCLHCKFSNGPYDAQAQCCSNPQVRFIAICKGCKQKFTFPTDLNKHFECFVDPPSPSATHTCKTCSQAVFFTESALKSALTHILCNPDSHESLIKKLRSTPVISADSELSIALNGLLKN
ncbi:hypothetical protein GEMRC1_011062 [Eukaryota sp. GEM-RC1]